MIDTTRQRVDAPPRRGLRRVGARLLHEPKIESDATDTRGCDAVHERPGECHLDRVRVLDGHRARRDQAQCGAHVADDCEPETRRDERPVRVLELAEHPGDVRELRDEHVQRNEAERQHQGRARFDPLQRLVLDRGGPGAIAHRFSQLLEQTLLLVQRLARRAGERRRLEERERGADGFRTDHTDRGVDGAFRTDDDRECGQQLRDVLREAIVADRELAEAEVDHPRLIRGIDEEVARAADHDARCAPCAASRPAPRCRAATRRSTAPGRGRGTLPRRFHR